LEDRNLPSFVSAISSSVLRPDNAAFGDFNGDGNLDFAAPEGGGNSVNVYLGKGDGTFQQGAGMVVFNGPKAISVGDFNGDGKLDLAVGGDAVNILLGNGDGTFQNPVRYLSGNNISDLIVLDVNRDGILDIVTIDNFSGSTNVLLGNGDGTFRPGQQLTGTLGLLTSGDFNNDGSVDLAVSGGNLTLYYGNGDGTFQIGPVTNLSAGSNAIAAGDLNGDGKTDLVVAEDTSTQPNNLIQVLLGNGDGTFQNPTAYTVGTNPDSIAIVDLNGDGRPDLAVANESNDVSVLLANGDGTFKGSTNYVSGPTPLILTVADFNHDGKLDLATVNGPFTGGGTIGVLLGNGDGTFQGGLDVDAGLPSTSVAVGDLNGDGKPDVVVAGPWHSQVSVFLGNGDGTFQPPMAYPAPGADWVALADLNHDGILDLVTLDSSNASVRVFMGKGDGTFGQAAEFAAGPDPRFVLVADLNNDGNPDIIETGSPFQPPGATVLLGNGDGTFQAPITVQGSSEGFQPPVIADFNNDGKPDLVLNGQIFFGNGDGTFGPSINLFNSSLGPPLAAGDLNGDGNMDLVFTSGANVEVMLGNGDGTFQSPTPYLADDGVATVLAGDVSGDGIPDILAISGSELWVFQGNGDGSFQAGVKYPTGNGSDALALGDLDGNGLVDLVLANAGAGDYFSTFTVLLNRLGITQSSIAEGSGDFTLTVKGGPFSPTDTVEWNGTPLPTTFVNSFELQATVPASDVVDEGTANISVTGFQAVPPLPFSILDSDHLSASGVNISGLEGQQVSAIVATFTDVTYPANSPDDFTATIDWGDGFSSEGTVSGSNGNFVVNGSHTYSDEGNFQFTVTIADPDSPSPPVSVSATASISEADSLTLTGTTITATEGLSFDQTVANFSDANTTNTANDFTATIDWGNGSSSFGIISGSNGVFTVAGSHTYAEEADYAIKITVTEEGLGSGNGTDNSIANIGDAPLSASGTPVHVVEGDSFSGQVATFTDANPNATIYDFPPIVHTAPFDGTPGFDSGSATIDWGDGTPVDQGNGAVTQPGGIGTPFVVSGFNHKYAKAGSYTISVTINDVGGSTATTTATATVTDPIDIAGRVNQTGQIWTGVSTGSSFTNYLWRGWNPAVTWVDVVTGDFTGDGRTAIAGRDLNTGNWWVAVSDGSSFTNSLWTNWNPNVTWVDVQVGDFTGDGKADIAGRVLQTGQWWVAQSTGSSFTNSLWTTWNPMATWVDVKVGNFSGDGKADIIGRVAQTGQWWAAISNGSAFTNSLWATWNPAVTWVDVQVGDFNGDGKADITGRVLDAGTWWTGISMGSSFSTNLWGTWNPTVTWVDVKVGDFNGDGKADIIGRVSESGQWWVGVSNGSGFTNGLWSTWSTAVTWVDVQVGDFNGDGKADITGRVLETGQWWTGISNGSSFSNSLWATWSTAVTWVGVRGGEFA
jgi:hypothetical protein